MKTIANAILRRLYLRTLYAHQRAYAARCEAMAADQKAEQAERRIKPGRK